MAGELEILSSVDAIGLGEREGRMRLLKRVVYLSGSYDWLTARALYAAVMRKIELGLLGWGDSFSQLEQTVVLRPIKPSVISQGKKGSAQVFRNAKPSVLFCANFQFRGCELKEPHSATINGRSVSVHHICAECWSKDRKKLSHPQSDKSCPYNSA